MKPVLRILLVDDDEDEFMVTRALLKEARTAEFQLDWSPTFFGGKMSLLSGVYDAALVDYNLDEDNGINLIHEVVSQGVNIPVILLTGQCSAEIGMQAKQAGAFEYLVKGKVSALSLEKAIIDGIKRHRSN